MRSIFLIYLHVIQGFGCTNLFESDVLLEVYIFWQSYTYKLFSQSIFSTP